MHDMGRELREKTKQREAHRKRFLQAELDRDAEAPAFDQIKQFGIYVNTIAALLASGSAATLPGQAEITGNLTNVLSQLQAALSEAESLGRDSPMDGTAPPAPSPLGPVRGANPPPDQEVPAMPPGRTTGNAHAFPAQAPQFSAQTGPALGTHFRVGPPLPPPADTFAPGQVPTPLFGAAPAASEPELQAKLREEHNKRIQAERLSDEAAAQISQAMAQKRKVEEHYKAQADKTTQRPLQLPQQPS